MNYSNDQLMYKLSKYQYLASQNPSNKLYTVKVNQYQYLLHGGGGCNATNKPLTNCHDAGKAGFKGCGITLDGNKYICGTAYPGGLKDKECAKDVRTWNSLHACQTI